MNSKDHAVAAPTSNPKTMAATALHHYRGLNYGGASGWTVVADAYVEHDLTGPSPSAEGSSWILAKGERETVSPITMDSAEAQPALTATGSYDWDSAARYAYTYAYNYNPQFCSWKNCNVDCANFVSQALFFGLQQTTSSWTFSTGGCPCGGGTARLGTNTWVNNSMLRSFLLNAGRGYNASSVNAIGRGDIINYDWWSSSTTTLDHVTMMTDGANKLVCSHTSDRQNVPWTMGGARSYRFTYLYASY